MPTIQAGRPVNIRITPPHTIDEEFRDTTLAKNWSIRIANDVPCPTVMAGGVGEVGRHQYTLVEGEMITGVGTNSSFSVRWQSPDLPAPTIATSDAKPGGSGWIRVDQGEEQNMNLDEQKPDTNKPPYRVPLMAEIEAIPWNGYNVISTFSGCGGSCLGYRMAGFKVLWANEFVPAAQDTYRRNHPTSILDTRDIRKVQAQEILDATGLRRGELDLLDGSPPCASFSTAGKREAGWGEVKNYSDTKQRTDDLFFEYARLLKGLQPKVFVAENVSGLVKGTAKGYFKMILAALKDCGYTVTAKLLDAQWLGVPQQRQRIIFVGVRNDIGLAPVHPKPLAYRYSVRDALPWIVKVRKGHGFGEESFVGADTVGASPTSGNNFNNNVGAVLAARVIHDTGGQYSMGDVTDRPSPTVDTNPRLFVEMETDISRYAIGDEWDKLKPGEQSDKYLNLVRPGLDGPSNTVTASGGNTSTASVTHPTEKRKFSIAELKRICAFPDDFVLTGSYAQQWERLGRSVPPVMMAAIASEIRREILDKCAES